MKIIKKGRYSYAEIGYKKPLYERDGKTIWMNLNTIGTRYIMSNGSIVVWLGPSTTKNSEGKSIPSALLLYIDLNGIKGPNTLGKDIFQYNITIQKGATLEFFSSSWTFNPDTLKYTIIGKRTHQELIEICSTVGYNIGACGELIMQNGWKIPDDYPLKF